MCDYSLHHLPNRLAVEGEMLQVHRFPAGSLGLVSPLDLRIPAAATFLKRWQQAIVNWFNPSLSVPAVCIPAGTHLILRNIPSTLQKELGVGSEEEVIFTQASPETNGYRDGVRFENGQEILLQRLPVRLQIDVLHFSESEPEPSPVDMEILGQLIDSQLTT
jgi:hypothetical protein